MKLTINAKAFRDALRFASTASDNCSVRYAFENIVFSVEPMLINAIKLVGTDGRRMHIGNIHHTQFSEPRTELVESQFQIDKNAVQQLLKLSSKSNDMVIVEFDPTSQDFGKPATFGGYFGTGKNRQLMSVGNGEPVGRFPNWKSIIPNDGFQHSAETTVSSLEDMIEKFMFNHDGATMVFGPKCCTVQPNSYQYKFDFTGDEFDLCCNLRFVRDAIKFANSVSRVELNLFKGSDIYRLGVENNECIFVGMVRT